MYRLIRPILFQLDPEKAHELVLKSLHLAPSFLFQNPAPHNVDAMGLQFPHPVGLAAGLDKNAQHLVALAKLGFSFIEVGTVTPRAQVGNPKPRLFRIKEKEALINRMGFNNLGVEALVNNIKKSNYQGILGINIGKNKETPLNKSVDDYLYCLQHVYPYASYVTVNISSPNTPDLRKLQEKSYFKQLLAPIVKLRDKLDHQFQRHVPLAVKISPDEDENTLSEIAKILIEYEIEAIIATNTSLCHDSVKNLPFGNEQGGLSGKPIASLSNHCIRILKECVGDKITLIGVGGVDSEAAAKDKLKAGATLIQVYTGLIYKGPKLLSMNLK